jgi:hypothetical protein
MLNAMPKPKQWTDQAELIGALKRCRWGLRSSESIPTDWTRLIRITVGANTFRAFHNMPRKPSEVFREWASKALFGRPGYFDKLLLIENRADYDIWLHSLAADFRRYWNRLMGCKIPFGPSLKLPNLLMKDVCGVTEIPKPAYDRLVWFLHVPLDSYSIQAIRNCIDIRLRERTGHIPSSAGMGFVKTLEVYDGLQEAIRLLAEKANVPPIALDIVAWDEAHKG